jgi:transposase
VGVEVASQLLVTAGDNPDRLRSEAAFAHLCGVAPLPASSGKTQRHRLNRGGDRAANNALWRIAMTRLRYDPVTRNYRDRRASHQKTPKEIMRCLKRYIAARSTAGRILSPADVECPQEPGNGQRS